ncbi:hypothetical protein M422DRAFT_52312 [Sphaerobolus stellatus SS14]|uniref:Uncharacterized protein n=1 Tax=Sphaerobolus stellatus (strain SS14) TaxID=990650 RepID=A0A0C9V8L3_SPHS4|nr:hypothetical protein M422DRAFT_52312 [Sphaerobolus stellatus SS14]
MYFFSLIHFICSIIHNVTFRQPIYMDVLQYFQDRHQPSGHVFSFAENGGFRNKVPMPFSTSVVTVSGALTGQAIHANEDLTRLPVDLLGLPSKNKRHQRPCKKPTSIQKTTSEASLSQANLQTTIPAQKQNREEATMEDDEETVSEIVSEETPMKKSRKAKEKEKSHI